MGMAKADSGILGLIGLLHHLLHQLLPPAGCSLLNIRNTPKQVQGRWGCWVPKPEISLLFGEEGREWRGSCVSFQALEVCHACSVVHS